MTDDKTEQHATRARASRGETLRVRDLSNYLSRLANLHRDDKTGNTELRYGLQQVSRALRRHGDRPIADLAEILSPERRTRHERDYISRQELALPDSLELISKDGIERVLLDARYSKNQLIELGVRRFGISHSRLARLNRQGVVEAVRAALDHELSLEVISQKARPSDYC